MLTRAFDECSYRSTGRLPLPATRDAWTFRGSSGRTLVSHMNIGLKKLLKFKDWLTVPDAARHPFNPGR
jgi:hypothetical protein